MRNLIHASDDKLDEQPTLRPIPRQHGRMLTEKEYTRHVREAGRRETALTLRVARAMKTQEVAPCDTTV